MDRPTEGLTGGAIAWMAGNPVAANLLMASLILGGLFMSTQVGQEVFPEANLDVINVTVPYPGASPAEVEQGIVLVVEEAVRGISDVKKVRSRAVDGVGVITIELDDGADKPRVLQDVKTAVDRIVNFPEDAEKPTVAESASRRQVVSLVLYGEYDEEALRQLAEGARGELLALPEITQVELTGVRPREISVEIPQATLREHGLTLRDVAQSIRGASVELPGGSLKTPSGETLLRTTERRDRGADFGDIALRGAADGTVLRVADVAKVVDGFRDDDVELRYDGLPAVQVDVYRSGGQTPIEVADAVFDYMETAAAGMPAGVQMATSNDRSQMYRDRVDLMLRNAFLGLVLVFVVLGLFLNLRLAFWVMLGIPISFCGAFLLMPSLDVTVNMISLFAFIVTLGIVVDDAIVVGENIYAKREKGVPFMTAAVEGVKEVATPVIFAVMTTVVFFTPLFFVPGARGKFFRVIPAIVIAVILISLVESLLVLPAHLAHSKAPKTTGIRGWFNRQHAKIGHGLDWFIRRVYTPALRVLSKQRYFTISIGIALLLTSCGYRLGGHIGFTFMPKIEGDRIRVSAELPVGAPIAESRALRARLVRTARETLDANGGEMALSDGIVSLIGGGLGGGGGPFRGPSAKGSHVVQVTINLVGVDQRKASARKLSKAWGERNRDIVGLERIGFSAELRTGGGEPVNVQLSHSDVETLREAAERVATALRDYDGLTDINDGFAGGKPQLDLKLTPKGRAMGLTERNLARQLRDSFFGAEAVRQQRGRDEVRVYVRLPRADRRTLASFEGLLLRTPAGGEIPLEEAAVVKWGSAYTEVVRQEGRRVINVTADIDGEGTTPEEVLGGIKSEVLPGLVAAYPGLAYSFEGQSREQRDTMRNFAFTFALALFVAYGLLAIPFRSYVQPLVILFVIPFGFVGAVAGHVLLGYGLSVISLMGIVALSGVVVNDSLILVVAINQLRDQGTPTFEAVIEGARRRFRPILLTTLTTFFGLLPMIFEPSVQARFLIPMAISLGFGILFATFIVLAMVPAVYLVVEDLRWVYGYEDSLPTPAPKASLPSAVAATALDAGQ